MWYDEHDEAREQNYCDEEKSNAGTERVQTSHNINEPECFLTLVVRADAARRSPIPPSCLSFHQLSFSSCFSGRLACNSRPAQRLSPPPSLNRTPHACKKKLKLESYSTRQTPAVYQVRYTRSSRPITKPLHAIPIWKRSVYAFFPFLRGFEHKNQWIYVPCAWSHWAAFFFFSVPLVFAEGKCSTFVAFFIQRSMPLQNFCFAFDNIYFLYEFQFLLRIRSEYIHSVENVCAEYF